MKDYIKGTFKKIIFKSDQNYIIGLFKVSDTNTAWFNYNIYWVFS